MNSLGIFNAIPLAIVDVETTGARPGYDRVIDIAIIRIEGGKVVEKFSTLLDPEKRLPASIHSLTGISEDDLEKAPTFATVAEHIKDLLSGCYFVAHNARFDYAFIKQELNRHGISFNAKCLCTVKLSRFLYPEYKRHDLSTLIERYGFDCLERHRALPDAEVLVDFLKTCHRDHGDERCQKALEYITKKSTLPLKLDPAVLDALPQSPGVYTFYGEHGEKLYIGKSINIRNRVLSHFSNDHQNGRQLRMVGEISDIQIEQTAGELSALLLESYRIKKEQPLYNRLSREQKRIVAIVETENSQGYKTVELQDCQPTDVADTSHILRICKSIRQAKSVLQEYAEEYHLCPGLLELEKSPHGCFWSQLGKCKGACKGTELPEIYNSRFIEAFNRHRIKRWPFKKPVLYTEHSAHDTNQGISFIIDDWRLIASYRFDESGTQEFMPHQYVFDYDSYKILSSFIMKAKPRAFRALEQTEVSRILNDQYTGAHSID